MKRVIVQAADLSGAALAQIKQWLGISRIAEDSQLTDLLHASLDAFEAFTGQMALEASCEEFVPLVRDWICISTRPVRAITGVEAVGIDGTRAVLASGSYEIDILADGTGRLRLLVPPPDGYVAVQFVAGIAPDWASLPESIAHGIIRLAAQLYRDRDGELKTPPPASVAALWQPWRLVRLT